MRKTSVGHNAHYSAFCGRCGNTGRGRCRLETILAAVPHPHPCPQRPHLPLLWAVWKHRKRAMPAADPSRGGTASAPCPQRPHLPFLWAVWQHRRSSGRQKQARERPGTNQGGPEADQGRIRGKPEADRRPEADQRRITKNTVPKTGTVFPCGAYRTRTDYLDTASVAL